MTTSAMLGYRPINEQILPIAGQVYRDRFDRSLLVLSLHTGDVLVEYANGQVLRIDNEQWEVLNPAPAPF